MEKHHNDDSLHFVVPDALIVGEGTTVWNGRSHLDAFVDSVPILNGVTESDSMHGMGTHLSLHTVFKQQVAIVFDCCVLPVSTCTWKHYNVSGWVVCLMRCCDTCVTGTEIYWFDDLEEATPRCVKAT